MEDNSLELVGLILVSVLAFLLLGGELLTERCRTDDLIPDLPVPSLPSLFTSDGRSMVHLMMYAMCICTSVCITVCCSL